jgi:hypothetical protein
MKIHAKQLNQEVQDLLDGNSSNGHCYNSDDEYHNSDSEQDLDNYEILKKSEFYQSVASEQKRFLDSLTAKQKQEFKDVIMRAAQSK